MDHMAAKFKTLAMERDVIDKNYRLLAGKIYRRAKNYNKAEDVFRHIIKQSADLPIGSECFVWDPVTIASKVFTKSVGLACMQDGVY